MPGLSDALELRVFWDVSDFINRFHHPSSLRPRALVGSEGCGEVVLCPDHQCVLLC